MEKVIEEIRQEIKEIGYFRVDTSEGLFGALVYAGGEVVNAREVSSLHPIVVLEKGEQKKYFFHTKDYSPKYDVEYWKLSELMSSSTYYSSKEKGYVFALSVGDDVVLEGTSHQEFEDVEITPEEYMEALKDLELKGFVTAVNRGAGWSEKYKNTLCFETKKFGYALVEHYIEVTNLKTEKTWFIWNPFRLYS